MASKHRASSQLLPLPHQNDDDDFQIPLSQTPQSLPSSSGKIRKPLKPSNNLRHPPKPKKQPKRYNNRGKENVDPAFAGSEEEDFFYLDANCGLDLIKSSLDCTSYGVRDSRSEEKIVGKEEGLDSSGAYSRNSIEARLLRSRLDYSVADYSQGGLNEGGGFECFGESSELDVLIRLCANDELGGDGEGKENGNEESLLVQCPLCGIDISDLSEESRMLHTNECLDKEENKVHFVINEASVREPKFPSEVIGGVVHKSGQVVGESNVLKWLRDLGLERYGEAFVQEEIDWDTLQWLTEEDLFNIGITALGPRKKIVHALGELRKGCSHMVDEQRDTRSSHKVGSSSIDGVQVEGEGSKVTGDETSKSNANKLITDYFPGSAAVNKKICTMSRERGTRNQASGSAQRNLAKKPANKGRFKDIPSWCSIPGTPFRVDAFKYLRGDCSYWFLTHFHMDHYQGLTKSFHHGKIYCSMITAKLVNMKIGIPWEKLEVLPLNERISIAGVYVTCLDANHCPGSIVILFEPPNGKAVLHTGDFRFSETMWNTTFVQTCPIHTLILDTTYCDPQYDFPKQEAVIQFVLEAIQAEAFNPKTLFLIGSYTIGKERLFLEVARVLRRKVHVSAAKFRLLECLGFSKDDMQWFTMNQQESQIHVVPMWTLASFKRLKHISSQYAGRFSLIVAFSPTGWTFGKGKKKSPGRRWQQGTIIRYEVPYSEHSSYTELKEFVKLASPENIIPSVNNDGPESASAMVSLLLS